MSDGFHLKILDYLMKHFQTVSIQFRYPSLVDLIFQISSGKTSDALIAIFRQNYAGFLGAALEAATTSEKSVLITQKETIVRPDSENIKEAMGGDVDLWKNLFAMARGLCYTEYLQDLLFHPLTVKLIELSCICMEYSRDISFSIARFYAELLPLQKLRSRQEFPEFLKSFSGMMIMFGLKAVIERKSLYVGNITEILQLFLANFPSLFRIFLQNFLVESKICRLLNDEEKQKFLVQVMSSCGITKFRALLADFLHILELRMSST